MARRYIGEAVIFIAYHADSDTYRGSVRVFGAKDSWPFLELKAPAAGLGAGVAYDSPTAYDKMACAAVSFGGYYGTHNRGDDVPSWAPSGELADDISNAVAGAQDDRGCYSVRRSERGPERFRGE